MFMYGDWMFPLYPKLLFLTLITLPNDFDPLRIKLLEHSGNPKLPLRFLRDTSNQAPVYKSFLNLNGTGTPALSAAIPRDWI